VSHSRRSRIAILLIVGALTGLAPLAIDFYLPGLPELTSGLHADASTGQLTLTACLLGIAFSQLVAGSISDTLARRGPVLVGLVAFAVASLLCAAAPAIWPLIGLRLAQGATVGIGFVIARAIVRDVYDGNAAARIFALMVLISGVAPVLAPPAGAQVLVWTSWRGIFVVLAALALALLAIAVLWLPETLADHLRHEPGLRAKPRGSRRWRPAASACSWRSSSVPASSRCSPAWW
jgi:DHA1 family bicyclomycin/chloramphenicol resistance-like MFS transporter